MAEKPKTNADRIREMSDEELAEKASELIACRLCPIAESPWCDLDMCQENWISWLRSPVEESDE